MFMVWFCMFLHNLPWQACCLSAYLYSETEGILQRYNNCYNFYTYVAHLTYNKLIIDLHMRTHTQTQIRTYTFVFFVCVAFYISILFNVIWVLSTNLKKKINTQLKITNFEFHCIWLCSYRSNCEILFIFSLVSNFSDQFVYYYYYWYIFLCVCEWMMFAFKRMNEIWIVWIIFQQKEKNLKLLNNVQA